MTKKLKSRVRSRRHVATSGAKAPRGHGFKGQNPLVRDVLFCFIFVVLAIYVYRDYVIAGKIDLTPDYVGVAVPFDRFKQDFEDRFREIPLWYPHIFGGMPFQASGSDQELQFSIESLINVIFPEELVRALHGRFFLFLLLGAFSMFFLGRTLSLSRGASFIAAASFVFSTHMMGTEHANRFICFMHIPLVFLTAYRIFDRGRVFDAILFAGAFGSQLCSFHPQIAFYTAMLIGLYAVYAVINDFRDKASPGTILAKSALFTGGVVVAVAVAAVLVLPLQEFAQYSARSLNVGGSDVNVPFATSWSFPPIEILTFIIPSFAGFGGQLYWGEMPFTDFPNYLGIAVIVLAVTGAVLCRSRMTRFLVIAAVLALLVSFGRHLPPVSYVMLHFVPFFGKFRAPVMILVLLQFAFALLAGFGIHALVERLRTGRDRVKHYAGRLCVVASCVLLLVLALTMFESSFQPYMTGVYERADSMHGARGALVNDADYHARVNALRFDLFMDDLWFMVLLFCAASGLIYASRKMSPALLVAGLSILVVFDLLLVASRVINPQDDPEQIEAYYDARDNEIVKTLKDDTSPYRILPVNRFNTNEYGYFGISTIGGYHPAKLGIYQELMDQVGFNSLPVLNMLNTRYLVTRQPLPGTALSPVVESDSGFLYRNDAALPRAFLVDSVRVVMDKNAIFEALKDPGFSPGEYAILEKPVTKRLGPLGHSSVEITLHSPHRIEMEVDAAAPCLLVLSEIYYPAGWSAEIDGDPTEILKTNYVLRSVVVPEGRHEVVMTFKPRSFSTGLLVSRTASSMVLVGLIGAGAFRIRKRMTKNG